MNNGNRSLSILQTGKAPGPFLPRGGANTLLMNMLDLARFGVSRSQLLASQAGATSYSFARTCLSYLLSNSLIEEENIDLYHSHFGDASKSLFFTTVRGFGFLRSYAELASLAGTLGEPNF